MPSPRHSSRLAALAVAALAAAARGSTHSAARPQHSVADVRSALRAVGLTGFRPISRATASDRRLLARMPKLVAYLDSH